MGLGFSFKKKKEDHLYKRIDVPPASKFYKGFTKVFNGGVHDSDNLKLVNENPYLFQVNPSYNSQIDEFAEFVSEFSDKNIILVHNGDSLAYSNIQMVKEKIFSNLSDDTLVNNIQFKEVVFVDSIFVLEHALSKELENVFIIPSNEEAFVTNVLTKLNTLKTFGNKVSVIGLSRWQRFKNIDPEYYFNLELCIASPFFID